MFSGKKEPHSFEMWGNLAHLEHLFWSMFPRVCVGSLAFYLLYNKL